MYDLYLFYIISDKNVVRTSWTQKRFKNKHIQPELKFMRFYIKKNKKQTHNIDICSWEKKTTCFIHK